MKRQVSIIICTRDNAQSLRKTLESFHQCHVHSDLVTEVIVVDNGSTDHTREIAQGANLKGTSVRHVFEPRQGKGFAYNRGMAEAKGDLFLFTDDDVRVPRDWIERMCGPIIRGEADAVAGGVRFPVSYEKVLASAPYCSLRGWFASTEGISAIQPDRMVGANMAFARHVLEYVPQFDTNLGPGALGFCDETLFAWQIRANGLRLVSNFGVAVEHHFDLSRLGRASLLSIARRMGASDGYLEWHWHHVAELPSRRARWRTRIGLLAKRLRHPWVLFSRTSPVWELSRELRLAYYDQLIKESSRPRRYERIASMNSETTPV